MRSEKSSIFKIVGANVTVKEVRQPVFKDGLYYARFNIINTGDLPLNGVYADYSFLCFMNESKRANLASTYINEKDYTYFDVPFSDEMDYNCKFTEYETEVYRDKDGIRYTLCKEEVQEVCMCCYVNINVTAKELTDIQNFGLCYPFVKGNMTIGITEDCLQYSEIEKLNLTKFDTIRISLLGLEEPCLRGEFPLDWCKERGIL